MNDPGLDEPIQETSKDVEQDRKDELDFQKEDEQAFLNPSRWWFASTAFPLLAVCATEHGEGKTTDGL
ncbi:MAG: hypothetical protein Q9199_000609 [Rusavskia elegans]